MSTEQDESPTVPTRVLGWSLGASFLAGLAIFPGFAFLEYGSDRLFYFSGPFVAVPLLVGAVAAALSERGIPMGSRVSLALGVALASAAAVGVGGLLYLALRTGAT